jgi:hypothetical protein
MAARLVTGNVVSMASAVPPAETPDKVAVVPVFGYTLPLQPVAQSAIK